MKRLSKSQWVTLKLNLEARDDPRATVLLLLLETGARTSEVAALTPADLDPSNNIHIKPLKGSNPRTIPLSPELAARIRALDPKAPIVSAATKATARVSIRRLIHRWVKTETLKVCGQEFGPHALRHTLFSLLYSETKDLMLVKQWAGHRSIQSTMAYMHMDLIDRANASIFALRALNSG